MHLEQRPRQRPVHRDDVRRRPERQAHAAAARHPQGAQHARTFFVVGENAKEHPEILKRASPRATRSATTAGAIPNFAKMSDEAVRSELDRTKDAISAAIGKPPDLLRPPYGSLSKRTAQVGPRRSRATRSCSGTWIPTTGSGPGRRWSSSASWKARAPGRSSFRTTFTRARSRRCPTPSTSCSPRASNSSRSSELIAMEPRRNRPSRAAKDTDPAPAKPAEHAPRRDAQPTRARDHAGKDHRVRRPALTHGRPTRRLHFTTSSQHGDHLRNPHRQRLPGTPRRAGHGAVRADHARQRVQRLAGSRQDAAKLAGRPEGAVSLRGRRRGQGREKLAAQRACSARSSAGWTCCPRRTASYIFKYGEQAHDVPVSPGPDRALSADQFPARFQHRRYAGDEHRSSRITRRSPSNSSRRRT